MEEFRDLAVNNQAELDRIKSGAMASRLYNEDLASTGPEQRTWTTYNIAALWIGMSVVITTYLLASSIMAAGMNWWQALLTRSGPWPPAHDDGLLLSRDRGHRGDHRRLRRGDLGPRRPCHATYRRFPRPAHPRYVHHRDSPDLY